MKAASRWRRRASRGASTATASCSGLSPRHTASGWRTCSIPVLAVHTSLVEPLPHQITAVYEEMLPRQPLRFLLADDPGAGKTIMAGLLMKEMIARGDLQRCLVVCPGSLAEQWQDELYRRFHLKFDILTNDKLEASVTGNWFRDTNLAIARLDKLSRNEDVQAKLLAPDCHWDLVVCDEAHKLSATFFGGEVKYTKRYKLGQLLSGITRHFLLMTATPHNGKEEDFQLFMALLDGDRFEGKFRDGVHVNDVSDLMRRMVKEKLLKFDGTPLFPARLATTVFDYAILPGQPHVQRCAKRAPRPRPRRRPTPPRAGPTERPVQVDDHRFAIPADREPVEIPGRMTGRVVPSGCTANRASCTGTGCPSSAISPPPARAGRPSKMRTRLFAYRTSMTCAPRSTLTPSAAGIGYAVSFAGPAPAIADTGSITSLAMPSAASVNRPQPPCCRKSTPRLVAYRTFGRAAPTSVVANHRMMLAIEARRSPARAAASPASARSAVRTRIEPFTNNATTNPILIQKAGGREVRVEVGEHQQDAADDDDAQGRRARRCGCRADGALRRRRPAATGGTPAASPGRPRARSRPRPPARRCGQTRSRCAARRIRVDRRPGVSELANGQHVSPPRTA